MGHEILNLQESGQNGTAGQILFDDALGTMMKSFKEKLDKKATGSASPVLDAKGEASDKDNTKDHPDMKYSIEGESKELVSAKGGRYCELLRAVGDADRAVENNPVLDKQIAKMQSIAEALKDTRHQQQEHIRETAEHSFSKQDWRDFSALGDNPFTDPMGKQRPFEFNNAQRAWLKENHPDVYKLLEKNDKTSLDTTQAIARLNDLVDTRDRPVTARLDLARYQQNTGDSTAAIETLTDVINLRPSVVTHPGKGDEFGSLAIQTGAAWDAAFRRAVESNGGNILDYVSRPMPNLGIKQMFKKPGSI